jgi:citryl-CoA lyase
MLIHVLLNLYLLIDNHMKFTTAITHIDPQGNESIRGTALTDLITSSNFTESIFLLLVGQLPNEVEAQMLDAMLTSVIDHGPGTPSALAARISASTGNDVHTSLAAGILALGEKHGLAIQQAMEFCYEYVHAEDIAEELADMKAAGEYVPGLGHKVFHEVDPRAEALFGMAEELGIRGEHMEFFEQVCDEVNAHSSKSLPINIDGAIAAILCDMDMDPIIGNMLFMIGRVPGLLAHIHEEVQEGPGVRRLNQDDIDFVA